MHLLKKLDNHSDTMQLAIFKNFDGISLGELLDFILSFNETLDFVCISRG